MNARDTILGRIRAAIGTDTPAADRDRAVRDRLRKHAPGVVPEGPRTAAARRRLFVEKAKAAAASVDVVKPGEEAETISAWLRDNNLPQRLRLGRDRRLTRIKWPRKGGPERLTGASDGNDVVALSHALAGIAETGTMVLASGQQNPTTLNFLCENHIVVLDAADIANDHESVWPRLRHRFGTGKMPRAVNMITGPSRSADIEQTLILGAHGPVRLHVIVVSG